MLATVLSNHCAAAISVCHNAARAHLDKITWGQTNGITLSLDQDITPSYRSQEPSNNIKLRYGVDERGMRDLREYINQVGPGGPIQ
jgi:hypothetical protein